MEKAFVGLCLLFGLLFSCQEAPKPFIRKVSTEPIRNLTPNSMNPDRRLNMKGTDLGVSFPVQDRLCFLFGDTITFDAESGQRDCLAFGDINGPSHLTWLTTDNGQFKPLEIQGLGLGVMDVPVEGIVVKDRVYLFFSSGYSKKTKRHAHSVLAHRDLKSPSWDLILDYKRPSNNFINISAETGPDQWIYLFGTGAFRKSAVYLARVKASSLQDPGSYLYFQGQSPSGPRFSPDEEQAKALFPSKQIGEISVVFHQGLNRWLMTYNINHPVSIRMRWSKQPWGPWSKALEIYNPNTDIGYNRIIHSPRDRSGFDDGLSDPGAEPICGGAYGPYLIPSWFEKKEPGLFAIRYTLSTWNPYQVLLMETLLATPVCSVETEEKKPKYTESPGLINGDFSDHGLSGWSVKGGEVQIKAQKISLKSGQKCKIRQEFLVDHSMKYINFNLYGKGGNVRLFYNNRCVRRTAGHSSHGSKSIVRWMLDQYVSRKVCLEIELVRGNLAAGPFEIHKNL